MNGISEKKIVRNAIKDGIMYEQFRSYALKISRTKYEGNGFDF